MVKATLRRHDLLGRMSTRTCVPSFQGSSALTTASRKEAPTSAPATRATSSSLTLSLVSWILILKRAAVADILPRGKRLFSYWYTLSIVVFIVSIIVMVKSITPLEKAQKFGLDAACTLHLLCIFMYDFCL
jgi:hypothetical protein